MLKRSFFISMSLLVLLGSLVTEALEGAADEVVSNLFTKTFNIAMKQTEESPEVAMKQLPLLLDQLFPHGILIPINPDVKENDIIYSQTSAIYNEFRAGAEMVTTLTDVLAEKEEVSVAALRVSRFLETMLIFSEQVNEVIETGEIENIQGDSLIQILNPDFSLWWWVPPSDTPQAMEEQVFTAEIPIWSSVIIVKEVKGIKLEVLKERPPWGPSWWWEKGLKWPYPIIWHIRLMPAEFLKTISYVNTWDADECGPKVVKTVDKEVITDEEIFKFWWFLADTSKSPKKDNTQRNIPKPMATTWGRIKAFQNVSAK